MGRLRGKSVGIGRVIFLVALTLGVAVADDGIWELQVSATDFLLNASSTASGPFAVIHDVNILVEVTTTTPLPQALLAHTAAISNGRIYVAGGLSDTGGISGDGGFVNNVYYCAQINPDGTLGEWQVAASLPQLYGLGLHSSVVYNDAVYVLGGRNMWGAHDTVYYALILSDGSLGDWQSTTLLPEKLLAQAAAVHNGIIYVLGGISRTEGTTDKTYWAQVQPDHTIAAWNTGTTLPKKLFGHKAAVVGNKLFVIGGTENGSFYDSSGNPNSNVSQSVYSAAINADGSLGGWVEQPSLPVGLTFHSAVASDSNIYVAGGFDGTGVTNAVYFAPVGEDGTLGEWESLSILPQSLLTTASVAHNGFVYVLGGGTAYIDIPQTSVYYIDIRPPIIYVDADAAGPTHDGSSWANAYNYLQDALHKPPTSGDEIWVAEGTYKPDANSSIPGGTGSRTATFQLKNGVAIKGGYAGFGEPDPNALDITAYETILSGDINTPSLNSDNSYHVVTGSGTDANAVLDGFTITAGYAHGSDPEKGGGMYNDTNSSPIVTDCNFSGNSATYGGGIYNDTNSSPTVTNCIFSGNSGGGMYNDSSSPTVTNCTFNGNEAIIPGGGMCNVNSSPTVTNCTFSLNGVWAWGGGMYNDTNSSPIVTDCNFSGNSAVSGGGMRNYSSSPTLTNCIFWGNTASVDGNEIALYAFSTIDVNYCDIKDGNDGIYNDGSSTVNWGTGNISANPLFLADIPDQVRLLATSPCIDAGDNNSVPVDVTTDLDGHPRITDGDCNGTTIVDMGAYEFAWVYIGDFAGGCDVDFMDFAVLGDAWFSDPNMGNWDPACDISEPNDGVIDGRDLGVFAGNWLMCQPVDG